MILSIKMQYQNLPFVAIDNEDDSYYVFMKYLELAHLGALQGLRCHRVAPPTSTTNKIKRFNIDFSPFEGHYQCTYLGQTLHVVITRGQPLLTTECRKIEYLKSATVYAPTLQLAQAFIRSIYSLAETTEQENSITIYQNNGGHWGVSKEKKPRRMESVIFNQEFITGILSDINDFVDSEAWYAKMAIPYKRSYLLYGPPGTGKSSLAQAIAAEIKFSICFVNCSDNINDFHFNRLLNSAPKKSIILVEDVDAIFSQRRNVQKNNTLTFSGFLNAIDGVRSQEGRIIIMTTNYKERLDPALLRPGRIDQMYEIGLANKYQIEKLCYRFFENEQLARDFSAALPEGKFAMSMVQGFLLRYRKKPHKIMEELDGLLQSDENVKIEQFLAEIGCLQCLNDFKLQDCFNLATARNLPKSDVQKTASKLSPLLKGRLIEALRSDRKAYVKGYSELQKAIQEWSGNEEEQRELRFFCQESKCHSIYQLRDKQREIQLRRETQA